LTERELGLNQVAVADPDGIETPLAWPVEAVDLAAFEHLAEQALDSVEELAAGQVEPTVVIDASAPLA